MKLYLDPGHGGNDSGATGNGLMEKDIALDIALRIRTILTENYQNVEVNMSRQTDVFKTLDERTNEANAWSADYFLSIHCNAFDGTARGYEDYIHSSLSGSSQTAVYQNMMHDEITKVNQLSNRGKKQANFHVLRESTMPALLTENGFIDHPGDAALLGDPSWRQQVAQGHANGLARAFNLEESSGGSDVIYRVIAGSFQARENADARVDFLSSHGIESFVDTITVSGEQWFRVQSGAFSNRDNAEVRLEEIRTAGISDAFIVQENL
ncbi:N-acetylmuramoyl-L-alanine amidase [Virgibacillus kimchii]